MSIASASTAFAFSSRRRRLRARFSRSLMSPGVFEDEGELVAFSSSLVSGESIIVQSGDDGGNGSGTFSASIEGATF